MATEPYTVVEAARHLRVDSNDPGYSDLGTYITAARRHVEEYLNASIAQQTRIKYYDGFPAANGEIKLPDGPVQSVTSIAYTDEDGNPQTVSSHILSEDRITPAYGESWPATRSIIGAVTITYVCGMMTGSPLALAEKDIGNAILLVLGDLWEHREAQHVGVSASINPTLDRLLHFHRLKVGI